MIQRRAGRCLLGIASAAVCSFGCENTPPPADHDFEATGHVAVAIGSEVRSVPFGEVRCESEGDGVERVELHYPAKIPGPQGTASRPRVLIARYRADEVLEAHAFVPKTSVAGVDYAMLQVIAASVEGADGAECRLSRGPQTELICNRGTVVPWLAPGDRPTPSFKVKFDCPDSP